MSDLATLEQSILADIAAAGDEAALEAVRVAALGKKGSISALLSTLGKMSPDERKTARRRHQSCERHGHAGAGRAPRDSEIRGTRRAACFRDHRRHAAVARHARRAGPHSSAQPGDGRTDHHLRRHGFCDCRRSGHRDRRLQLYKTEFSGRPSGPRDARHLLLQSEGRRLAHAAAYPHLAGAGAHHADPEAADPHRLPRPHLSHRFRRHPHAAVSPGRRPRDRQGFASRPFEMDPARILQGVLRGRPHQHAVPAVVLSVHRAVARGRHPVPPRQGRDSFRRRRGLAGDSRLRHGAPQRAARLRHRSRCLPGFRLGHGHRPHRDAEIRHPGFAPTVRERRALAHHYGFKPLDVPTLAGRVRSFGRHEIHALLAEGTSRHRRDAGGARGQAHHDRA